MTTIFSRKRSRQTARDAGSSARRHPITTQQQSECPDGTQLLREIREGWRSCTGIIRDHLARLQTNHGRLHAAVEVLESESLAEASEPVPGALSGLPVSLKEVIGLAGRTVNAGSTRMPPIHCENDAAVAIRLKKAGAIVIARGNVPEFAMAGETDNLRYGQTINPLNEHHTCGGSSGGDAALVASASTPVGIGTDILGSIRIPASFCGIVGFKPTSGSVNKNGTWPNLSGFLGSWLAVGPMARTVRDCRLVYDVIAKRPTASPEQVAGLRLIIPHQFPMQIRELCIQNALLRSELVLRDAGMIRRRESLGDVRRHYLDIPTVLAAELEGEFRRQLSTRANGSISLLRESVRQLRGKGTVYAGLYRLLLALQPYRLRSSGAVRAAIRRYETGRARTRNVLADDGIILLPTTGMLAPRLGEMNKMSIRPGHNPLLAPTSFPNYMDLPAITVPAWKHRDPSTGLVPGMMLISAPGSEGALLDAARILESAIR